MRKAQPLIEKVNRSLWEAACSFRPSGCQWQNHTGTCLEEPPTLGFSLSWEIQRSFQTLDEICIWSLVLDFIRFAALYPTLLGKYFASKSSFAFLGPVACEAGPNWGTITHSAWNKLLWTPQNLTKALFCRVTAFQLNVQAAGAEKPPCLCISNTRAIESGFHNAEWWENALLRLWKHCAAGNYFHGQSPYCNTMLKYGCA